MVTKPFLMAVYESRSRRVSLQVYTFFVDFMDMFIRSNVITVVEEQRLTRVLYEWEMVKT